MYELAKEHYFKAQERRDRLRSTASLLVGVIAVIGSASAYLFEKYEIGNGRAFVSIGPETLDSIFLGLTISVGVLILITVGLLVRLLSSRMTYEEIGNLQKVLSYKNELEDYCKRRGHLNAEEEFQRDMAGRYSSAAETNRNNNQVDLARIKWSAFLCGIAGMLVLFSAFVYAGNKIAPGDLDRSSQKEERRDEQAKQREHKRGKADTATQQGNP